MTAIVIAAPARYAIATENPLLDATQKEKLAALLKTQHAAILITQGDAWPTATMQAFAETDALEIVFILGVNADKFQNLLRRPNVTVFVDARETGDIPKFQVVRASIQGVATEVPRGSAEWQTLEKTFLAKNPFEAPFFGSEMLRMVRVTPKRVSYAGLGRDVYKAEF